MITNTMLKMVINNAVELYDSLSKISEQTEELSYV